MAPTPFDVRCSIPPPAGQVPAPRSAGLDVGCSPSCRLTGTRTSGPRTICFPFRVRAIQPLIALLALPLSTHAAEPRCAIRPRELWAAYFGGVEKVMHVDVTAREAARARASWTLSVAGRVVDRKELGLALDPTRPAAR